jgi:uncharacterized protein YqeY
VLAERIKKLRMDAIKARDTIAKEVLGVALGEIETNAARAGGPASDEDAAQVVRKLVKSNQETLAASDDAEQKATLERENAILLALLPQTLGPGEIAALLEPVREEIRAAKSDGQATGVAMKHLKASGSSVSGKDVSEAVKKLRA